MFSIDASTIDLCLKVFDWAHFRRAKGAVKLHLLLDHAGYLPCWAYISDGKCADIKAARMLKLPAGAIVTMDRGYNDYALFGAWCTSGVYFVTRIKDKADYQVISQRKASLEKNITADEVIKFNAPKSQEKCPHPLRLVSYYHVEKGETMQFQGHKAEPEGKDFSGNQRKCGQISALDSTFGFIASEVLAIEVQLRLEPVQSGGPFAHEPVDLPLLVGLA